MGSEMCIRDSRLESRMREIRQSGSEGGAMQTNVSSLPLSIYRVSAEIQRSLPYARVAYWVVFCVVAAGVSAGGGARKASIHSFRPRRSARNVSMSVSSQPAVSRAESSRMWVRSCILAFLGEQLSLFSAWSGNFFLDRFELRLHPRKLALKLQKSFFDLFTLRQISIQLIFDSF